MGLNRPGAKTYWHLVAQRRMPTTYEVVSSLLHYYPAHGFAVATPARDWYRRHQLESAFSADDWEAFADPRSTTYAAWTARQREQEAVVAALLRDSQDEQSPAAPDDAWLARLDRGFAPLRYPCHALMMLASYLGSMAPSGKITIAAALQAGDEIRRVHRLAYRLRWLQRAHPQLGASSRQTWETDRAWQPLRELIERALVTWDWGECFAALNLVIKPSFDALALDHLARVADRAPDPALAGMLRSLADDARWHGVWSRALVDVAIAQRPANRDVLAGWVATWRPRANAAVEALAGILGDGDTAGAIRRSHDAFLRDCGIHGGDR